METVRITPETASDIKLKPGVRYVIEPDVNLPPLKGLHRVDWTYKDQQSRFHLTMAIPFHGYPDLLCQARVPDVREMSNLPLEDGWKPRKVGKRWCKRCLERYREER